MSLTPALLQPFLALLLLTASPVSSQSTIQSLNDLILDTTTNNNNNNHNNHNNPGWTTTLPESMQPPPLISPLSAPSSLKPPTILHHDIPPYCGPSAVALSIDLRPDNPSSNTSLQLPSLLSLLGACSWLVTNDTNRPQVDIDLPAIASKTGYFACGVPDTGGPVKVYLTVRYVQQAPEVPGRVVRLLVCLFISFAPTHPPDKTILTSPLPLFTFSLFINVMRSSTRTSRLCSAGSATGLC